MEFANHVIGKHSDITNKRGDIPKHTEKNHHQRSHRHQKHRHHHSPSPSFIKETTISFDVDTSDAAGKSTLSTSSSGGSSIEHHNFKIHQIDFKQLLQKLTKNSKKKKKRRPRSKKKRGKSKKKKRKKTNYHKSKGKQDDVNNKKNFTPTVGVKLPKRLIPATDQFLVLFHKNVDDDSDGKISDINQETNFLKDLKRDQINSTELELRASKHSHTKAFHKFHNIPDIKTSRHKLHLNNNTDKNTVLQNINDAANKNSTKSGDITLSKDFANNSHLHNTNKANSNVSSFQEERANKLTSAEADSINNSINDIGTTIQAVKSNVSGQSLLRNISSPDSLETNRTNALNEQSQRNTINNSSVTGASDNVMSSSNNSTFIGNNSSSVGDAGTQARAYESATVNDTNHLFNELQKNYESFVASTNPLKPSNFTNTIANTTVNNASIAKNLITDIGADVSNLPLTNNNSVVPPPANLLNNTNTSEPKINNSTSTSSGLHILSFTPEESKTVNPYLPTPEVDAIENPQDKSTNSITSPINLNTPTVNETISTMQNITNSTTNASNDTSERQQQSYSNSQSDTNSLPIVQQNRANSLSSVQENATVPGSNYTVPTFYPQQNSSVVAAVPITPSLAYNTTTTNDNNTISNPYKSFQRKDYIPQPNQRLERAYIPLYSPADAYDVVDGDDENYLESSEPSSSSSDLDTGGAEQQFIDQHESDALTKFLTNERLEEQSIANDANNPTKIRPQKILKFIENSRKERKRQGRCYLYYQYP